MAAAKSPPATKRALGMGLSRLFGEEGFEAEPRLPPVRTVPIELLRPSPLQPRRRFDEGELALLAASIREKGVLQPLLVRPAPDGGPGYEIVAGERRWRAAQQAGLHELPTVVRALSEKETLEVALIENVQRADLSPLEEAEGFRRLIDEFGHTQEELAATVGKSRSHVANLLRLLALPAGVRELLQAGSLTAGHARALLGASEPERLARLVVERGLNVRDTEELIRRDAARARRPSPRGVAADPNIKDLQEVLTTRLGLEVGIRPARQGGLVTIRFHDLEQLDGLVRRLQ